MHEAEPGEAIHDVPQTLGAPESLVPAGRFVAVHLFEELGRIPAQRLLELPGATAGRRHIPLGRQPRVQQAKVERGILDTERQVREPLEQAVAIGSGEYLRERVAALLPAESVSHGEQVQVVIAQGHRGRPAQRTDAPEHRERGGTSIHQVADEPEAVPVRREAQSGDELAELGVATLHVADCVEGHRDHRPAPG